MSKASVAIIMLSVAFVASNAWWLYNTIDFGITHTYAMQQCDENDEALKQTLAMLPVVAKPGVDRRAVIAAASQATAMERYEKDGFIWVGRLGLRFDESGKLSEVTR